MSRVAILGLGAIGSVLTKYLQEEGRHELFYFNRSSRSAISLHAPKGSTLLKIQLSQSSDITDPFDYLVICLKEYQYEKAKQVLSILMARASNTVVFRNGIDLTQNLPSSKSQMIETIIDCPVETIGPSMYNQLRAPKIILKESEVSFDFSKLFAASNIEFAYVQDFRTEQWKKLIESACLGGVLSLAKQNCSIFEKEEYISMYERLLEECISVARADGAQLPENFFQDMLVKRAAYPKTKGSSMLTDLLHGRRLELYAKNKAIYILAKKYGIATPVNDKVCKELEAYNRSLGY